MKLQVLTLTLVTLTVSVTSARTHDLQKNGIANRLKQLSVSKVNKKNMHPLIAKYTERVQKGQFEIEVTELQALYEELSKITQADSKYQI